METKTILVDRNVNKEETYSQAVEMIRNGEVVAFPTETVYGLGADATNPLAIDKIFSAKGRPVDNPLIVHVDGKANALAFTEAVSDKALQCMEAFWPGALTLVLKSKPDTLAENVTAGLPTVGIRVPDHPVALNFLKRLKLPIAAPSANTSGKPSPTKAEHVFYDLNGKIPLILDGGATEIGIESTVLDMTSEPPVILRPGHVTKEQIEAVIGKVRLSSELQGNTPKSPGIKYTHYAPDTPVYLIENDEKLVNKAIAHLHEKGRKVAVLSNNEFPQADYQFPITTARLYDSLRQCDATEADLILASVLQDDRDREALMNRLEKAADHKWFC